MNLLDAMAVRCCLMNRKTDNDGEGGYTVKWSEGPEFENYATRDSSLEARRAEAEGVTSVYTGIVRKEVPIEYGDYYKDLDTGTTFRVTSKPEEKQAPGTASKMLRGLKCFTAERKELPQ
nr:MAG TPA: head closure knob [Caudoviricetes sp.]